MGRTLASLAAQTNDDFTVYVCDDASPEDIESIVRDSAISTSRIRYHRFESNLGGRSLSKQWDRCIGLTDEPWIWLFSDDDTLEEECVSAFYRTRESTRDRFDLYRFSTVIIDGEDRICRVSPPHPDTESWSDCAYYLLRNLRVSTQQETVFRRSRYDEIGGFLDLPLAWGTDHAFTLACGTQRGLAAVRGPRVRFRQSGTNISSRSSRAEAAMKLEASMLYVSWLMGHLNQHGPASGQRIGRDLINAAALEWFDSQLRWMPLGLHPRMLWRIAGVVSERRAEPMWMAALRIARIRIEQAPRALSKGARRIGIKGRDTSSMG